MKKVRFAEEVPIMEFSKNSEPAKKIASIQFSLLSGSDIQKSSQLQISQRNLYHPEQPNVPFKGGPLDTRLGISERGKNCETCKKSLADCPGHFGFIKLEMPVFHVGYFKHIVTVLQCICKECCKVLLTEPERLKYIKQMRSKTDPLQRQAIQKNIMTQCKKIRSCQHCGAYNGIVKKFPGLPVKVIHDKYNAKQSEIHELINEFQYSCSLNPNIEGGLKVAQEDLDPLKVYNIFQRIRDEDVILFDMEQNMCKPIDMLITQIPVPPVCIRPSVAVSTSTSNEDDLTVKLAEIIQLNNLIKISIQEGLAPSKLIEDWTLLQYTIAQYFNSETPGLPHNLLGNKQIRALNQRLKGKHGRFRQNLSGKRVDFTGRTVISPDPNCAIDEVMIPIYIAKNLTYPERVNQHNLNKLKNLVQNGPELHPGANFVESEDGNKILLQYANRKKVSEELKIGDIVERHIENGDVVLFNRQPSLHRVSIMAHRARVMPFRTLRFNECVCTPYNADFDGDEMNIHLPQTEEARAEARILMDVKQNLLIPRSGEPLIAPTQDFLTSSYLITQKDRFLNRSEFMRICAYFWDANERIEIPPPTIMKPVELWTGKQIINVLLRPNRKSNVYVNTVVKERNYSGKGEYMCPNDGWVIFQNSELICGNLCKTTMGSGSKTGLFYSLQRDNSVEVAAQCMLRVAKFSSRWISNYGMSIGISDVTPFHELIQEKQHLLDIGYKNCDILIEQYKKGDLVLKPGCNLEQTLESYLNGELSKIRDKAGDILKNKLPKHNAPLIMAICGSKGSNINLCQMIALVGQQTVNGQRMPNGFFDRSLPHFEPQSKYPASKGFVKNSFYSGLTATEFFFHTIGGREGLVDTAVKTAETGYMQRRLMKALEDLSVKYDDTVRTSTEHVIQFQYGDDGLDPMFMDDNSLPVSLKRLIIMIKENTKTTDLVISEEMLLPFQIQKQVQEIPKKCPINKVSQKFIKQVQEFMEGIIAEITKIRLDLDLKDGLTQVLSESEIIKERKDKVIQKVLRNFQYITQSQYDKFIDLVWLKYQRAQIQPGEAVGAVAAQSIGEPGTQMTLKTFHFAGVASMNVTLGVPRIKEIINATKEISTPIISAKLVNDIDLISARIVKGRIEKTILGDIAKYIKEVYTPRGCYLEIKLDINAIQALKLELSIQDIKIAILKTPKIKVKEKNVEIAGEKKIHIQPFDTSRDNMYFSMQQLKNLLPNVIVKGIPTVVRAVISKQESDQSKHQLLVEGYGLKEVMSTPGIDFRFTKSNHVIETEQVLGIEAARQTIINEIQYTMQSHGMNIDPRHIQLLADIMTFKGQVLGITRFGVSKMKNSTLMLASFEMTTDHLYDSAVHCKKDDITGVSECIIMGNMIPIGTGLFKIVYDETINKKQKESLLISSAIENQSDLIFDKIDDNVIRNGKMVIE